MNAELKNKAHNFLKEKNVNFNKPMGIYDVELHMALFAEKLANDDKTSTESERVCPNCKSKDVKPYKNKYCCYECGNYFGQT